MKPQDFMEALGGVSQEKLDALAKWQEAGTPIPGGASAKADRDTQTAAKPGSVQRGREIMKQKAKWNGSFLPLKIGSGAALAACAVIAVSVGVGIIGLNQHKQQMQVGSNVATSVADQISEREPIEITDYRIEGFDVVMDVPETGTAQLLHTVEDARSWINFVRQNGEYGRKTDNGAENFRTLLENGEIYQEYDLIITAVPYHFVYQDYGIAMYGFCGGTITESGKLTLDVSFLTVNNSMKERIFQEIETFCCCFAVPKNSVPDITEFVFHDVIYDCTAPVPDGCETREEHLDYLYSMPNYQEFMDKDRAAKYLRWVKDEMQPADTAREPVLLGEPLSEFNAERNEYFPQVSEKGSVQVIRSMEDMQPLIDATTSQLQTENYGEEFYGRCGINEALFENNDLLYFAFYNDIFADNMSTAMFCGGEINEDGSLTLRFSELIIDDPADDIPQSGSQNCYYFYPAPKGALPDISEIKIELEEFHVTLPERVLEHRNEIDEATGQTIETQYLETAQAKLDYMDSIPQQLSVTWGKSAPVPPENCVEGENGE